MRLLSKLLIGAGVLFALGVAAPVATLYMRQESYLFPVRQADGPVAARPGWERGTLEIPGEGRIAFLFAEAQGRPDAPVLLFLHGNAGSANRAAADMEGLVRAGIPVVAAEYPGYGGNPGGPSEASLNATAEALARWARARWPGRRLAALGESIGSAPAVHLATSGLAERLVLDSGFTSMSDTIRVHKPWLPAVDWLNRHPMDNLGRLRAARPPLPPALVIVSARDGVVPVPMGEALAAALPCTTLYRAEWSGHAVLRAFPPARAALERWLLQDPAPCPASPGGAG